MNSEGAIKQAIYLLIDSYGMLNTTQLKAKINEVLDFDEEDKRILPTRREPAILQRVGNIVCHQDELIRVYPEGYIVDKNTVPARFFAVKGLSGKETKISDSEIEKRKKLADKRDETGKKYKKINWDLVNERRTLLGAKGEEFVYSEEINFVKSFDQNAIDRVRHLSAKQGDGFGYDIISINDKGESVYIEVKTTEGPEETPFYMSINEKSFFEDNIDNNAFIYRVYNFNEYSMLGTIKKISAAELFEKYDFDPISFKVTKK